MHTAPAHAARLASKPSAYRWVILTLAWAAFTMTSIDRSVWGPAALNVADALGRSIAELGIFATCYYIGYVISNFLGGFASDWAGPRAILVASMVLAGGGMIVFGSAQSFAMGLIAQAFVGLFAGADYSAGAKSIASWFQGRERNFAIGIFTTATSLGTVVANLVVPRLIAQSGWRTSYYLFGAISIVVGLAILVLHRSRPAGVAKQAVTPTLPQLGRVFADRNLILLAIAGFCSLWGTYGFITWSNTLMVKGAKIDPVTVGLVIALFAITAVILKPVVGWVSGILPFHRKYLAAGILVMFSVMLLIFGSLQTVPAFLIAAPFLGFAAYCYSPIQNALVLDYAGSASGSASGVINAVWQLGSVIVPTVVGIVVHSSHSFYSAFVVLAIGPVVGALIMLLLTARYRPAVETQPAAA